MTANTNITTKSSPVAAIAQVMDFVWQRRGCASYAALTTTHPVDMSRGNKAQWKASR